MNKRQKIIVSIVGIFIVLLALVGLTYAYFLTRIVGNTNDTSVSITTALLELKYDDEDNIIVLEDLIPGQPIPNKTFSVSNTGNGNVTYGVYLENVINELKYQDDLLISITCTAESLDTDVTSNPATCSGVTSYQYPETNEQILTNTIEPKVKHNYVLTVTYLDDGDQSDDMGKSISGKVQIYGVNDVFDLVVDGTNLNATDILELHSEVKTARRVGNNYVFKGVMPDDHTLKVVRNGEVIATKEISIEKGESESYSAGTLLVTNGTKKVSIKVTGVDSNNNITIDNNVIFEGNSFGQGTLAYQIINNAKNVTSEEKALGYAEFSVNPKTIPAKDTSQYGTGEFELSNNFDWTNMYYGDTQSQADTHAKDSDVVYNVSGTTDSDKCESVVGKYLSQAKNLSSKPIGKVNSCSEEGKPYIEINVDEQTLSTTADDYNISYYYRGAVKNNYINFAGMCWRIVRIEGDGSIKLVLEDKDEICSTKMNGNWNIANGNFGYTKYAAGEFSTSDGSKTNAQEITVTDYLHGETDSENSMATAFKTYQETLNTKISNTYAGKTIGDMLKSGNWCINDKAYSKDASDLTEKDIISYSEMIERYATNAVFRSDSHIRLYKNTTKTPTLKCNGTLMHDFDDEVKTPMYVGALTADEVVFAGGKMFTEYSNYYLINQLLTTNALAFRTLSPGVFNGKNSNAFQVNTFIHGAEVYHNNSLRPSISLASNIIYSSGDGSIGNPYTVS